MITADSSVWIDYLNGRDSPETRTLDAALDDNTNAIVLLDVVLMEVLRGFSRESEWRTARTALAALPLAIAGGEEIAVSAAQLYRDLRRKGSTVRSAVDLLVGAWCIRNDCELIHNDRDFEPMQASHGLRVFRSA